MDTIPPGMMAVTYEGYLHGPWRYRHVSSDDSYNRLSLTTRATAIDPGGIMCNPTSGASRGSEKSQIGLKFKNEFI
jgi:hypothetical protein